MLSSVSQAKGFAWMYNRSVQFIFQLSPNLLDGVEVRTLRGPFQQIPSVAGHSGNFIGKSLKKIIGIIIAKLKNNKNLLNMPSVLTILATRLQIASYPI